MYRCLICHELFHMEQIMGHVRSHDNFWLPWMTIPNTVEEFRQRYSQSGLFLIELVDPVATFPNESD